MAKCKSCNAEIVWVEIKSGKPMPCNPELVQFWANPNAKGKAVMQTGEIVSCDFDGPLEEMTDVGYISHFATCPFANSHRRKRKP